MSDLEYSLRFAVVPEHIRSLQPYKAGKTIEEVIKEYHPTRISKLASNENRLGCSPFAKQAAIESLHSIQNYPDPQALVLRKKIAETHGIKPENVITASGSEGVMSLIIRAFFSDTDQALTSAGTFIGFKVLARSRGVELVEIPLTSQYAYDLPAIAKAITKHTRIIYLANANNPTGTYFTDEEFEAFMDHVPDHVLVIMDEAYFEFAEAYERFPDSMRYRMDNVITLRTFSKAYGLAGFRVGYGMAHEELIQQLFKVKPPFDPSTPAQAAAVAAMDDKEFLHQSLKLVERGKQRCYTFLEDLGCSFIRSASNSVLLLFDDELTAQTFTLFMLKRGIILRHLPAFGIKEGVRVTIGLEEEMNHFEEGMRAWMNR